MYCMRYIKIQMIALLVIFIPSNCPTWMFRIRSVSFLAPLSRVIQAVLSPRGATVYGVQ